MDWLKRQRIEIERWNFRRKQRRELRRDAGVHCRFIRRANKQSRKTGKQLWVFRFAPCEYYIYTKPQMKSAVRSLHIGSKINIHQTNEFIVHITQKPE